MRPLLHGSWAGWYGHSHTRLDQRTTHRIRPPDQRRLLCISLPTNLDAWYSCRLPLTLKRRANEVQGSDPVVHSVASQHYDRTSQAIFLALRLGVRNHRPQLRRILALRAVRIDCSVDVVIGEPALHRAIDEPGACIQNGRKLGVRTARASASVDVISDHRRSARSPRQSHTVLGCACP